MFISFPHAIRLFIYLKYHHFVGIIFNLQFRLKSVVFSSIVNVKHNLITGCQSKKISIWSICIAYIKARV